MQKGGDAYGKLTVGKDPMAMGKTKNKRKEDKK